MDELRVEAVLADGVRAPLQLLEEALRGGHPVSNDFEEQLGQAVETGDLDVLAAWKDSGVVGVAVISYRLNVSAGGRFASIEDLYVRPETRRQGVGRTLLKAATERCVSRGISYVEVQVEDDEAERFYSSVGYEWEDGVRVFSRSHVL